MTRTAAGPQEVISLDAAMERCKCVSEIKWCDVMSIETSLSHRISSVVVCDVLCCCVQIVVMIN